MKLFITIILAALIAVSLAYKNNPVIRVKPTNMRADRQGKRVALRCAPPSSSEEFVNAPAIPLLEGWGNYRMPVTAINDSARIYFNQGINMYYGFHIVEALASFVKATSFDSSFAMGYWGQALAMGPNINGANYSTPADALTCAKKAAALSSQCAAVEKELIASMLQRYLPDTTQKQQQLYQAYAGALKKIMLRYPGHTDVRVLYADALMQLHPWDLYTADYQPRPWTLELVDVLEKALKSEPRHPGALHYYIHAVEGSTRPERGLTAAKQLPVLMPGLAHLVHMPSHIYIRSGYYDKGDQVNEAAVKRYYTYTNKFAAVEQASFLYLVHTLHMQAACANMAGRSGEALRIADDCRKSFDSSALSAPGFNGVFAQYVYMTPLLTMVRFGKWEALLSAPAVPGTYVYANIIDHYGRGLAYARTHQTPTAIRELELLKKNLSNPQLAAPASPGNNPAIYGARIAEKILEGVIAEEQNDLEGAITLLRQAVKTEDNMAYSEPKDWALPARQYLGAVLLKAGRYQEAQRVYERDLQINPKNGWSLTGLATALLKQGIKNSAAKIQQQAAKAFEHSDVAIRRSVF
ncbi:MAG: tetratricopeptide repeat protein [Niabella sp.]|nr:tetratricopeptide repeat protein [Niabella sp.]